MSVSSPRVSPAGQLPAPNRERLLEPRPPIGLKEIGLALLLIAIYVWGVAGTNASPQELVAGLPNIWNFFVRLFPPEWVLVETAIGIGPWTWATVPISEVIPALIETVQMAVIGTTLAIFLSLPFSFLAARNVAPHRLVYQGMRFLLNVNRAIPDIIIALVFVAAVGLGPFSGVLAIAIGSVGTTAKLYAEAIEAIDPAQVQAVRATGAGRIQTFIYGVVPQAMPLMASYSLLLFEGNVRSASILGIVGAGGIGLI
ncbi:MAG: phosphonate ABC transporter, permease protein PhnE, partial [Chloroflexia bacterium]|nr:phosphonate ABC transporter, permease protein PhnE [Chloroflexia bacterium]